MEKKATFKGAVRGDNRFGKGWEHTELMYEYRGHTYFVTKDNNGYMGTPLWKQHEEEQRKIDKMIEDEGKPSKYIERNGADEGFELFWEYVTEGE